MTHRHNPGLSSGGVALAKRTPRRRHVGGVDLLLGTKGRLSNRGIGRLMEDKEGRGISRRRFLQGTAAASLGTAATVVGIGPAAAEPIAEVSIEPHGAELRGLDLVLESPTSEGRFGYMFKNQPPLAASEDLLTALGQTMEERPVIGTNLTDPETGEPVLKGDGSPVVATKRPQRRPRREPEPTADVGVHLRRSVHRPRHHVRHHDAQ